MKNSSGCGCLVFLFLATFGHLLIPMPSAYSIPSYIIWSILSPIICLLLWVAGNVYNTNEYHQKTIPKKWRILVDNPDWWPDFGELSAWFRRPNVNKIISLAFLVFFLCIDSIAGANRDLIGPFVVAICTLVIWLLGVILIERHFRKHYTSIQ